MNKCGVYKITCTENKKYYIGSSNNIKIRWKKHKRQLNKNKHPNKHLQNAWNKYGESTFKFEILCESYEDNLLALEQKYIDETKCYNKLIGFNICKTAGPPPIKTRYFKLKDPNGKLYEGNNVSKFAREHNLNHIGLIGLVNGLSKSISYKGWTLPDTKLPYYKLKSPIGEIYRIEWNGCSKFAKKHNLHGGELSKVLNKKAKSVKGWTLA